MDDESGESKEKISDRRRKIRDGIGMERLV